MEFFIKKINGKDVTKILEKEILNTLQSSEEPIMVELCHRIKHKDSHPLDSVYHNNSSQLNKSFVRYCDSCTQTDGSHILAQINLKRRPKSGDSSTINNWEQTFSQNKNQYSHNPTNRGLNIFENINVFGEYCQRINVSNKSEEQVNKDNKEYKNTKVSAFDDNIEKADINLEEEMASLDHQMQSIRLESKSLTRKRFPKHNSKTDISLNNNNNNSEDFCIQNNLRFIDNSAKDLSQQKMKSVERWIRDINLSNITPNDKIKRQFRRPTVCDDSSSAYNTGESSRSTPPMLELTLHSCSCIETGIAKQTAVKSLGDSSEKMVNKSTQFNESDLMSIHRSLKPQKSQMRESLYIFDPLLAFNKDQSIPPKISNEDRIKKSSKTSIVETSPVREKGNHLPNICSPDIVPNITLNEKIESKYLTNRQQNEFEWKVKRRSDGSRYITSRSVRNKFLKQRALKIMEDRFSNLTTDDDTTSELKMGRYWNRDQRRKHFQTSKQRKRLRLSLDSTPTMSSIIEHSDERHISCDKNENLH